MYLFWLRVAAILYAGGCVAVFPAVLSNSIPWRKACVHLSGLAFEPIIDPTVSALTELGPELIAPGHCTGWRAQHTLAAALPDAWVQSSVGTTYTLGAA